MEYQALILPTAEADLERLLPEVQRAILRRLAWLRAHAGAMIHHRLQNMPEDLSGLCRLRHADYRILYWHYPAKRIVKIYRVQHRSEVYRDL